MKTQEVAEQICIILHKMPGINPKQIFKEIKGVAPMPQVYSALKMLVEQKLCTVAEKDKVKTYTLTPIAEATYGKDRMTGPPANRGTSENGAPLTGDLQKPTQVLVKNYQKEKSVEPKPIGRDLTTYSFNNMDNLNKGRLALAVVKHIAVINPKLSLKDLTDVFNDDLVRPYGVIKKRKEAIEISKGRPRFFIKEEESVFLADGAACVSNQWTKERIQAFIDLAQTKFKLKIK